MNYAHVEHALNILTGVPGSTVRVFIHGDDHETYYQGVLVDRVVMDDRLAALVIEQTDDRTYRVSINWSFVESLIVLTAPEQEPTP